MSTTQQIAMVAITKHGARRLAELGASFPQAEFYVGEKHVGHLSNVPNIVRAISPPYRDTIGELFRSKSQLVLVFSVGAAIRFIAPLLKSKEVDPGVLVIDDAGKFVVPILAGHLGGANEFALELAPVLGAQAVLTTASESLGTLTVDTLGRELGWVTDSPKTNLVKVATHVVNDEPIAFVQECGSTEWHPDKSRLPRNIQLFDRFEDVDIKMFSGVLWVTRREVSDSVRQELDGRLVIYRPPPPIVLGIGCDRNTSLETLETAVGQALAQVGSGLCDVKAVATVDKKAKEPGLLALVKKNNWAFHAYPADRLSRVEVPHPSHVVLKHVGTPSVSEAAALLAAGAKMDRLLVEKHRYRGADERNATVSIVPLQREEGIIQ